MFKSGLDIDHLYDLADEGCDIVNASYRNCIWNSTEAAVIDDIHDLGVIIVAAAGNGPDGTSCGDGHDYCYPASYPHVISVTAVSHLFPYGYHHPVYGDYAWEDCHEDSINHPTRVYTHNDKVDLCAPAYHVHTATLNDSYTAAWGTSFASPIVAGLCALVLAENPGLDPDEVETILKSTAFDLTTIPENEEFSGLLGAGRINAYSAVNAARETNVTYSSVPYSIGFESGLDENWTMYESHRYGRSVLNTDHSPHTGSYHITMDVLNNGYYNTNEAWLHLNLSGESDVILQFWWKDTGDESHISDGIYISDDGGDNFTKIYNLTNGSSTYSKVSIDLSNEIDDAELDHSSTFVVKFQQYDNYTIPTDGIAIDDVQLCVPLSEPSYISGPYEHCIFEWEEYTCTSVPGAVDYDWNFTGKYLSGSGTTVEVMDTHDGWYTLSVRAENACGQYSDWKNKSIYIDDCMGKMMENPPIFWIIPNPADSQVEIVIDQEKLKDSGYSDGTEYRILIIDIKGVIVYDTKTIDTNNKIDISRFPNGNYTVQLIIDEDVFSQILIVEH